MIIVDEKRALELTKSDTPGKGLWWEGCHKTPEDAVALQDAMMASLMPRVLGAAIKKNADSVAKPSDKHLLKLCQQWNPSLKLDDVRTAMDSVTAAIRQEVKDMKDKYTHGSDAIAQGAARG